MPTATAPTKPTPGPHPLLPTVMRAPSLRAETAKVLLYGPPKIGKTTFCASMDPQHTLILATEPGQGAISGYIESVSSWASFREFGAALAQGGHDFTTVVIDTVDNLYDQCADDVMAGFGVRHASDLEYGKGWSAIRQEFALRVAKLAGLGLGVWMVSHAKTVEVKTRVGAINVTTPTLSGQGRDFVTGFVDYTLFATSQATAEGEQRLIRTLPSENYEAGGRAVLRDPLPFDPTIVRAEMALACDALIPQEKAA